MAYMCSIALYHPFSCCGDVAFWTSMVLFTRLNTRLIARYRCLESLQISMFGASRASHIHYLRSHSLTIFLLLAGSGVQNRTKYSTTHVRTIPLYLELSSSDHTSLYNPHS